ncbi:DNA ligase [Piscinibacter sakaiensis]|uniref:DNA ligase (ATP) n=1 Tax=Piscinibacter sakaiensis TaxID=1547922 RepID=A0A0K8P307_PISS1|nr:DNA ligase [Piscinibacter sakaiensis]GAP36993.1 DNA ligase (ATP) [Piscinibacter sakaiensis]
MATRQQAAGPTPPAEHLGPLGRLGRRRLLAAAALFAAGPWPAPAAAAAGAPALLLATEDGPHVDPREHLVSEKYDGVRAHWDGRQFRFRSGRTIAAPDEFLAWLPPGTALDGELWLGRRRFDALSGLVRRATPSDPAWRALRYLLFELPGGAPRFDERVRQLQALAAARPGSPLQAVEQRRVADRAELMRLLDETVRAGGEGLMLHRADAPYRTGRSELLVKLKPQFDAEGVVVAHLPGQGRHAGRLGALELRLADGRRLRLGTGFSDAERDTPPPLGSIVSFRYRERTPSGLPRFASFLRVREEP